MKEIVIRIDKFSGVARTLWSDEIDLRALGTLDVTRASNVEFDNASQAWCIYLPTGELVAGGFETRDAALATERTWANAQIAY